MKDLKIMKYLSEKELKQQFQDAGAGDHYFSGRYAVRSSETDRFGEAHLEVIFSLMQEVSQEHVSCLEQLSPGLKRPDFAWILNRMSLRLERLPRQKEEIRLYTWQSAMDRLGFTRDYYFFDRHGEAFGAARSYWTIVTPDTHSLMRPDALFPEGHNPHICPVPAFDQAPRRLRPNFAEFPEPETLNRRVGRSDIDQNGHMNNTRYIALCIDAADFVIKGADLKSIDINYVDELFEGEDCHVEAQMLPPEALSASEDKGLSYIAVRAPNTEGRDRFRALLGFDPNRRRIKEIQKQR